MLNIEAVKIHITYRKITFNFLNVESKFFVCTERVFHSLPHAIVWFSLSAWEERRWYNDIVIPFVHLLFSLTLWCFSANALHALAHIL